METRPRRHDRASFASRARSYFDLGIQILELAQHAHDLFEQADPAKKRRLLETLYSNSTWAEGRLEVTLRQPSKLIAMSAE